MYYQRNIVEQLQVRYQRMMNAVQNTYYTETKYLLDHIWKTPLLRGIVQELETSNPEINWNEWKKQLTSSREFSFPDTESAMAKVCYEVVKDCSNDKHSAMSYAFVVSSERNIDYSLQEVTKVFFTPFIQYLVDQVGMSSNALYLLEKYKRRTEWFYRDELLKRIQVDSRQSEFVADTDLRKYLFDQGIDYPFSTPLSTSGRADIVADIGESKPLIIEVKLFDPERGYDRTYIRKGLRQIFDYATDFNQSTGYLVIFNCSNHNIVLRTKIESRSWPTRIELDHRTFYLIVIELSSPDVSSSKRKPIKPYNIDETFLLADESDNNKE